MQAAATKVTTACCSPQNAVNFSSCGNSARIFFKFFSIHLSGRIFSGTNFPKRPSFQRRSALGLLLKAAFARGVFHGEQAGQAIGHDGRFFEGRENASVVFAQQRGIFLRASSIRDPEPCWHAVSRRTSPSSGRKKSGDTALLNCLFRALSDTASHTIGGRCAG